MAVLSIVSTCELLDKFTSVNDITVYVNPTEESALVAVQGKWVPVNNSNITTI